MPIDFGRLRQGFSEVAAKAGKATDQALVKVGQGIDYLQSEESKQKIAVGVNNVAQGIGQVVEAVDSKLKEPEVQAKIASATTQLKEGVNSVAQQIVKATETKSENEQ